MTALDAALWRVAVAREALRAAEDEVSLERARLIPGFMAGDFKLNERVRETDREREGIFLGYIETGVLAGFGRVLLDEDRKPHGNGQASTFWPLFLEHVRSGAV